MENGDISKLIFQWDVGVITSFFRAKSGEVNDNWIIQTSKGKFVLRRLSRNKKIKDLNFEIKYLNKLRDLGFAYKVPEYLLSRKKSYVVRFGRRLFVLYRFIEGNPILKFRSSHLRSLAKGVALYHKLLLKLKLDNGNSKKDTFYRNTVLRELNSFRRKGIKKGRKIFLEESEKLVSLLKKLDVQGYSKIPKYPIHRDFNPENILWSSGKLTGFLDFENVSRTNDSLVKDLCIVMQYACVDKKKRLNFRSAKIFLKEYMEYKGLSKKEISFIPDIMIAGFIEDFSFVYWQLNNFPKRTNLSRLEIYSKAVQWYDKNREKIIEEFKGL